MDKSISNENKHRHYRFKEPNKKNNEKKYRLGTFEEEEFKKFIKESKATFRRSTIFWESKQQYD